MTKPPPRKRFQIHLSTAIVMMFVAGGLIGLNSIDRRNSTDGWVVEGGDNVVVFDNILYKETKSDTFTQSLHVYGWPYRALIRGDSIMRNRALSSSDTRHFRLINWKGTINLTVVLLSLLIAMTLCEYLIRRRAARKGA